MDIEIEIGQDKEEVITTTDSMTETTHTTQETLKELKESSQQLKNLINSLSNSLNEMEHLSDYYDYIQHLMNWVYSNCYVNNEGKFLIDKKEYTWLSFLKAINSGNLIL
jgi:hypothetical protein